MLQQRTLQTTLAKVKAHANINGDNTANHLAKQGKNKAHLTPTEPHEFAHSTPYYLHRDTWIGMASTPHNGPIRHL
jgi:hypothetical protein